MPIYAEIDTYLPILPKLLYTGIVLRKFIFLSFGHWSNLKRFKSEIQVISIDTLLNSYYK